MAASATGLTRLLVADPDGALQSLSMRAFWSPLVRFLPVRDALSALSIAWCREVDLAIISSRLPPMGGLELLRCLRRDRAAVFPILMVARADAEGRGALRAGAAGYLLRPVSPELLLTRVRTILERSGKRTPLDWLPA